MMGRSPQCYIPSFVKIGPPILEKKIFFFFFFLIQFNVPFKIISLIETSQSIGGQNGRTPGKPPDTPASRTWLVSHVASAGLEPTPDTAVKKIFEGFLPYMGMAAILVM